MMTTTPEVVLGVTGSIGAYRAADIIRHLKDAGYAVTCLMTARAKQFITPLTLQALSERKVYTDLFELDGLPISHTALADRSKLILVAPATANLIGKFANGVADDPVTGDMFVSEFGQCSVYRIIRAGAKSQIYSVPVGDLLFVDELAFDPVRRQVFLCG